MPTYEKSLPPPAPRSPKTLDQSPLAARLPHGCRSSRRKLVGAGSPRTGRLLSKDADRVSSAGPRFVHPHAPKLDRETSATPQPPTPPTPTQQEDRPTWVGRFS